MFFFKLVIFSLKCCFFWNRNWDMDVGVVIVSVEFVALHRLRALRWIKTTL